MISNNKIDKEYNCSNTSKVKINCVYKGKYKKPWLTYEVKCSMCDTTEIDNPNQSHKKIMDANFSDNQHLIKMDKNHTYFIPTTSNTLNILIHTQNYVSV